MALNALSLPKHEVEQEVSCKFTFHPNYLLRVCGEPADLLAKTFTGETFKLLYEGALTKSLFDKSKKPCCDLIEKQIKGLEDRALTKVLLSLKRDIYNCRIIEQGILGQVSHLFREHENVMLNEVAENISTLHQLDDDIQFAYETEFDTSATSLGEIWKSSQNFRKALSYSNSKLFEDFESLFSFPQKKIKSKKRRQLEASLMRYAARISRKTSPLSTFTPVFVGKWDDITTTDSINFKGMQRSLVEPKSGLVQFLADAVLSDYEKIKPDFSLKLNPSLSISNGSVRFRKISEGANTNGRIWGTGQEEVSFKLTKHVQCVFVAFQRIGKSSASIVEIVEGVKQLAPKFEEKYIDQTIKQLFEMQVFTVEDGFYGQLDMLEWCKSLLGKSKSFSDLGGEALFNTLANLMERFEQSDANERIRIKEKINQTFEQIGKVVAANPGTELKHPSFFENSYIIDKSVSVSKDLVKPFLSDLQLLMKLSPLFDIHHVIQSNFSDYFIEKYGTDGKCSEVASFVEEFSSLYGVGQIRFTPDTEKVAKQSSITSDFLNCMESFMRFLQQEVFSEGVQNKELDHIRLSKESLLEQVRSMPASIRNRTVSHSFLGQIAKSEDLFVVNQVFSGQSGLLSRFLEGVGESDLEHIREYLESVSTDGDYAELPGVFGFNGNRHPKMAERELDLKPFSSNFQKTQKISLEDLALAYDEKSHKVNLIQKNGKVLDCFYQGFLMPLLLPNLHKTLAMLNMSGVLIFLLPIIRSKHFLNNSEILLIPRVSVGNTVIIRKSYMVPRDLLPDANVSGLDFYKAMVSFIEENNLPKQVFLRVAPFDTNPGAPDSKLDLENMDFKNMKPFFFDLRNPRLVQLLQIALKRSDYPIVMSEVLPDGNDQNVMIEDQEYVAEVQFELTKSANYTNVSSSELF